MGKEADFISMIKTNQGAIFKITTIYTNNGQDQKDLYQEIVYQLWKSFDSFKNRSKISTWLYRVALNTAITHLKRTKRKDQVVAIEKVILQQTAHFDDSYEERIRILYHHIQQLNTFNKGIMLLLLEGKSYDEIAEIIGITTTNVGTRISRIKQKLRKQIVKT